MEKINSASIRPEVKALEEMFTAFNKEYFTNSLPMPVITISNNGRSKNPALGTCTSRAAWYEGNAEEASLYEISIKSEYLNRSLEEIAGTLLHEMVHEFCGINDIKDTSRGGSFHNTRYKEAAEARGLIVSQSERYGWAHTTPNEICKNFIASKFAKYAETFNKHSAKCAPRKTTKSNSIKYVCPVCGAIVRATKEVNIMCMDCDELMIAEQ